MTTYTTGAMRAAAVSFAAATAYTSAVAIREGLPGQPLGIGVPLSVSTAVKVGWGSAVSAPWLMPLGALIAVTRPGPRSGLVCAGLGVAGIVGIGLEPNTYRVRTWVRATRRAALAHTVTCALLAGTGILQMRRTGCVQAVR
jgi:hypothetical protein